MKKVAIQGIHGAFHEEAAIRYFKKQEIELVLCKTFSDLIESVETKEADSGIMAIENTIAGSILPNYTLIENSGLKITGEIYLRIVQNLIAKQGVKTEEIDEVFSHPMALYQCSSFFKAFPKIKLIESFDTAISAKDISETDNKNTAAIASSFAAKRYNLNILAESIEDNKLNYTRFFELNRKNGENSNVNKASICFSLSNKTGSLAGILSVLAFYDINLHKIQSLPIIGKPWKYSFYIDLVFSDYERYKLSINAVIPLTENLKILGEYKEGNKSFLKLHKTQENDN